MGHYLGEMESQDSFITRTVYEPMRKRLKQYDKEVARGLMHTDEWHARMERERQELDAFKSEEVRKQIATRRRVALKNKRFLCKNNAAPHGDADHFCLLEPSEYTEMLEEDNS